MGRLETLDAEEVRPYLNEYLFGNQSVNGLADKFEVSRTVIHRALDGLVQEMINEGSINNGYVTSSKVVVDNTESVTKEFTIGDWSTMTREQQQEYRL